MFKLEFDPNNKPLAAAMGAALTAYGRGETVPNEGLTTYGPDGERLNNNEGDPIGGDCPYQYDPAGEAHTVTVDVAVDAMLDAVAEGNGLSRGAITGNAPATDEDVTALTSAFAADGTAGLDGPDPRVTAAAALEVGPYGGSETVTMTGDTFVPDTRVDTNNVVFDEAFCGTAESPFYGSGKRAGQWKKKRGVTDPEYDEWYAEQLAALIPETPTTAANDEPLDTAGAFSNTPAGPAETVATPPPANLGELMGWVSEMSAAGRLMQSDIDAAYATCNVTMSSFMAPTPPDEVAGHLAAVHTVLLKVAGNE